MRAGAGAPRKMKILLTGCNAIGLRPTVNVGSVRFARVKFRLRFDDGILGKGCSNNTLGLFVGRQKYTNLSF